MSDRPTIDAKVYPLGDGRMLSMRDLLEYFARHGTLRVSDLHLKVGSPPTYRIDGSLQRMKGPPLDGQMVLALAGGILSQEQLDRLRQQRSVDGSYLSEKVQFRLNCFHDNEGLALAIRALEQRPMEVEQIGFPNHVWRDVVNRQWGLVLVTGITGAGKSTTIASMITRIADTRPVRVITLEDPIEYRLTGKVALISQREVGRDVPDFARGLRDCLREDPDVIFVGEMRDRESAIWTMSAAETGHLVFSTLHTRDARGTVTRLLDMFPPEQQDEVASQLSLGLSHIICQKLVPRANGGGRVAAMEILTNTYAMANLIRLRKMEQVYTFLQTRTRDVPEERMVTLERSLAMLVREGKVTALEAEKWANHPSAFLQEMQALQAQRREAAPKAEDQPPKPA
jgi:twitching motility protein PilT